MLDLFTGRSSDCTGLSRRSFLRVGGLATLGLTLPTWMRLQAAKPAVERKNVSCILLWMQGGPSHHDTFDPKPDAPAEVRGEFKTIPTTLSGVHVAEHLPMLAKQTDRYSIIRGHDPKNGSHGTADHLMMTSMGTGQRRPRSSEIAQSRHTARRNRRSRGRAEPDAGQLCHAGGGEPVRRHCPG